jgi:hypothetical protein
VGAADDGWRPIQEPCGDRIVNLTTTLWMKGRRINEGRKPAVVRELPVAPKPEGFSELSDAYLALRAAQLSARPTIEPVVATTTAHPHLDAHKLMFVPPAEFPQPAHAHLERKK